VPPCLEVCCYFTENFCIHLHRAYWFVVSYHFCLYYQGLLILISWKDSRGKCALIFFGRVEKCWC
jgi:hypothetical protein